MSAHYCHARACTVEVRREYLMCPRHWRMVPKELQSRVWATYQDGQCVGFVAPSEEWHDAADAAIDYVEELERKRDEKKSPQGLLPL